MTLADRCCCLCVLESLGGFAGLHSPLWTRHCGLVSFPGGLGSGPTTCCKMNSRSCSGSIYFFLSVEDTAVNFLDLQIWNLLTLLNVLLGTWKIERQKRGGNWTCTQMTEVYVYIQFRSGAHLFNLHLTQSCSTWVLSQVIRISADLPETDFY